MSTRVSNNALQAQITAQAEQLAALVEQVGALTALLVEQQVSAASNPQPKAAKARKAAAETVWAAKLPAKYGTDGQHVVLAAVHERDWTWVSMSCKPAPELAEALRASGGKYGRRRNAWFWRSHVAAKAALGKLAKYAEIS